MAKKRNKKAKTGKTPINPKDKQTERIVYLLILLMALFGLITSYLMSKEFAGKELQENGHFKKIEKEQ